MVHPLRKGDVSSNLSTKDTTMTFERQGERKPFNKNARPRQEEQKKINVEQVVSYLNHAFARAQQKSVSTIGTRNVQGTKLYDYQVDFCYLIDEIQRGPVYILPKVIQDANQLIINLERETNTEAAIVAE